jgi:hypothetical protein
MGCSGVPPGAHTPVVASRDEVAQAIMSVHEIALSPPELEDGRRRRLPGSEAGRCST